MAAAYLRLYRTKHSAPEDLGDPDRRPAPKERAPFGPSTWIALSVGRTERAEPRWLLPLLCRAGGLTPDAIGAIRVQTSETFVELAEASVPGFLASLGEGGRLEDGVTARVLDAAPAAAAPRRDPAPRPRPSAAPEPAADAPSGDVARSSGRPVPEAAPEAVPEAAPVAPAADAAPAPRRNGPDPKRTRQAPVKHRSAAPRPASPDAPPADAAPAPRRPGQDPERSRKAPGKPRRAGPGRPSSGEAGAEAPRRKPGKPGRPAKGDRAGADGPRAKGGDRAGADGPRAKGGGSGGAGKRRGPKAADAGSAMDTSKRYTPPKRPRDGKPEKGAPHRRSEAGERRPRRPKP